ncbi:MAG TPA: Crp/Fnr family transcriptional regulator [Thermomicrobiales bacterium]|nr:Crp/Fnr family transcriptional regulator [Thermomicrobiales bacterium]
MLIELSDEFGEPTPGGRRIPSRVTQLDLSRMIGVSRETVSRLITEFVKTGIVSRESGRLVIHDRACLAEEMTAQD